MNVSDSLDPEKKISLSHFFCYLTLLLFFIPIDNDDWREERRYFTWIYIMCSLQKFMNAGLALSQKNKEGGIRRELANWTNLRSSYAFLAYYARAGLRFPHVKQARPPVVPSKGNYVLKPSVSSYSCQEL